MPTATLQIVFPTPPSATDVHRIRNFAEALESALGHALRASVEDTDSITTEVRVHLASTRHLGVVTGTVRRCLAHHNLLADATVTILK